MDRIVAALLAERRIASLGTINPDGSVHLTAVWYWFDEGRILIPTVSAYRKVLNVRERHAATVMVDTRSAEQLRGVTVSGPADVLEGPQALETNRRIHSRYLTTKAMEHPVLGPLFDDGDDVTIRVQCDDVAYWDMEAAPLEVLFSEEGLLRQLDE